MELQTSPTTFSAKVIVRHSGDCADKPQGQNHTKCKCPKSLLVYEGKGTNSMRRISAKTRSWAKAEAFMRQWLDDRDPDKVKIKLLKAELDRDKDRASVTVADAVAGFCTEMISRKCSDGTVQTMRALLGNVDPETKAVLKNGHLFDWLDKFNSGKPEHERLIYVFQITPAHLDAWRGSWTFGSDLTRWLRWRQVCSFFKFCERHSYTHKAEGNPALKLLSLKKEKGSRTATFTDAQYDAIVAAVAQYEPGNEVAQKRLLCFVELLRHAGMAIGDGLHYRPDMVNAEGTLQYNRRKSGELATIPLPAHMVKLLAEIPPAEGCTSAMPFRDKRATVKADLQQWDKALRKLFSLAGIETVLTKMGKERKPHAHMLRDTFAVWHIRHGAQLRTVAKMLGHSQTATTERSYLPWVEELEQAHVADARRSLENGKATKAARKGKSKS